MSRRTLRLSGRMRTINIPKLPEPCEKLLQMEHDFFEDPLTKAQGASDCWPLVERAHKKRCGNCIAIAAWAKEVAG